MSKAFFRESDFDEPPEMPQPAPLLPPGIKNNLTPDGAQRLRAELDRLVEVERPPLAASAPHDREAKRDLQSLDHRIHYLQNSLRSAEVIEAPENDTDTVRFGATVRIRDSRKEESVYRIVGVDETDIERGWISWLSPMGRALLNARVGQRVPFKFPAGMMQLDILEVSYDRSTGAAFHL